MQLSAIIEHWTICLQYVSVRTAIKIDMMFIVNHKMSSRNWTTVVVFRISWPIASANAKRENDCLFIDNQYHGCLTFHQFYLPKAGI